MPEKKSRNFCSKLLSSPTDSNVVLIDPKGVSKGLNVGLGYLSAILLAKGLKVKVIDLNNNTTRVNERFQEVKHADFVGIFIKSPTASESIKIARKVKEINPQAIIACGGVHVTLDGYNFLRQNTIFD